MTLSKYQNPHFRAIEKLHSTCQTRNRPIPLFFQGMIRISKLFKPRKLKESSFRQFGNLPSLASRRRKCGIFPFHHTRTSCPDRKGEIFLPLPLNLSHYFLKMALGIIVWIPLLPSTIWVTLRSTARLDRAYASSGVKPLLLEINWIVSRRAILTASFRSL